MGRFSDRTLVRTYADNNLDLFEWLEKHGVKWEGYRGGAGPARPRPHPAQRRAVAERSDKPRPRSGFVRPLAATARKMGVDILLQHRMTKIHREQPLSGRVIGITAIEVDDNFQPRARRSTSAPARASIVATGGCADNVQFRTMFDVRLTEEYHAENSPWSKRNADGEIAAMEIGASLGATACQTTQDDNMLNKGRMGARSNGSATEIYPTSPHFFRAKARRASGSRLSGRDPGEGEWPALPQRDRGPARLRLFRGRARLDRRSEEDERRRPDLGDLRAEAVTRERWDVKPPHVDPDGYFFTADTIEELAKKIVNPYQWRPMPPEALRKTVDRYNTFVDNGVDEDFKKPIPLHKVAKPPFYAAWHTPAIHDSYTGIRINTSAQVIDLRGRPIPGLYACGDSSGGFGQHGICRAATFGRIAGNHVAQLAG